jgi:Tat protein secretion system quality control protein TatD with DNase activity
VTQLPPSPPHREALKFALLERILLETEAPTPYQGKTWEPADLMAAAAPLSRLKGVGPQRIKEVTTLNGDSLGFK